MSESSWMPFSDPKTSQQEKDELLSTLYERISIINSQYQLTPFELSKFNVLFILEKNNYNVDISYEKFMNWIKWRRGNVSCSDI